MYPSARVGGVVIGSIQTSLDIWVTKYEEPDIDLETSVIGRDWVFSIDVGVGDTQVYLVVDDQGVLEDYMNDY